MFLAVSDATKAKSSSRTFLEISLNGNDFSCITRCRDCTPVEDKNNKSVPIEATAVSYTHLTLPTNREV